MEIYLNRIARWKDYDMLSATSAAELTDKNYVVYCDNNPGSRADDERDTWYIIAGAAVAGGEMLKFAACFIK